MAPHSWWKSFDFEAFQILYPHLLLNTRRWLTLGFLPSMITWKTVNSGMPIVLTKLQIWTESFKAARSNKVRLILLEIQICCRLPATIVRCTIPYSTIKGFISFHKHSPRLSEWSASSLQTVCLSTLDGFLRNVENRSALYLTVLIEQYLKCSSSSIKLTKVPGAFHKHLYIPCQVYLAQMEPWISILGHVLLFRGYMIGKSRYPERHMFRFRLYRVSEKDLAQSFGR